MERREPQSVAEVLRNLLEETSLQGRMDELRAAASWPRVVGAEIAGATSRPLVKNGVMSVGVPNASLRHELHMNRSRLREILNKNAGKEIITEIRFTS